MRVLKSKKLKGEAGRLSNGFLDFFSAFSSSSSSSFFLGASAFFGASVFFGASLTGALTAAYVPELNAGNYY